MESKQTAEVVYAVTATQLFNIVSKAMAAPDYDLSLHDFLDKVKAQLKPLPLEEIKQQAPGAGWVEALADIRNNLYDNLPKGEVDSWELLQAVKWHLNEIDNFISHHRPNPN